MAACNFDRCVFGEAPWTTGSSPVVTSRGSTATTSLSVVAMPLRTRALPRQEKPSQESIPKNSSLERREAERREAHHRAASTSDAARALSPVFPLREDRGPGLHRALDLKKWSGRARLSAPHRGIRGFSASARLRPRFLEPPDANGRTLSGTSAASTSRSDTRRTGRCPSRPRAQCMAAPDENRSRSALRSTLAKGVPLRAGFWLGNRNGDESQGLKSLY